MKEPLKSYDLYEVYMRPPIDGDVTAINITNIRLTQGQLVYEGETNGKRAYYLPLCDNYKAKALTIQPGGFGAIRALPSPENPDQGPRGELTLQIKKAVGDPDKVESFTYSFPWEKDHFTELDDIITCKRQGVYFPDVMIVGSGPLGATFARRILDQKPSARVMMVETGAQESVVVGEHKKNNVGYQKDIDSFVHVIKGALNTLSVPVKDQSAADAGTWARNGFGGFIHLGQNPQQDPSENLSAAAATRVVGGMATHWTCATPEQLPGLERSEIFTEAEWKNLYAEARGYLGTRKDVFEHSIRHLLVKNTLKDCFAKVWPDRKLDSLPLAAKRSEDNDRFVVWAASDTILGETVKKLHLYSNHHCTKLVNWDGEIKYAVVKNLRLKGSRVCVVAKKYILCGGAILNPQILWNSGFRTEKDGLHEHFPSPLLPALGKNLTEQPLAFCQIILDEHLVDALRPPRMRLYGESGEEANYPAWVTPEIRKRLEEHARRHPNDPVPFPLRDQEPQITTPVQEKWPWHTQIHRDAFSYGDVVPTIDSRLVVDLRWFARGGVQRPRLDIDCKELLNKNEVTFSTMNRDQYNMPQPTFKYALDDDARSDCHRMMEDMVRVSLMLGRYVPGSEPKFMDPGLTLHICGTTAAGFHPENSVVNKNSEVWGVKKLWLGGNGVVPGYNACNPTLTSMCFAIRAVDETIVTDL